LSRRRPCPGSPGTGRDWPRSRRAARRSWCRWPTGADWRCRCPAPRPASGRGFSQNAASRSSRLTCSGSNTTSTASVWPVIDVHVSSYVGFGVCPPEEPTTVVYALGSCQSSRAAPQKQPIADQGVHALRPGGAQWRFQHCMGATDRNGRSRPAGIARAVAVLRGVGTTSGVSSIRRSWLGRRWCGRSIPWACRRGHSQEGLRVRTGFPQWTCDRGCGVGVG
jgi:hypothetical protein